MSARRPACLDPLFHLGQVPRDVPTGEGDAAWEFPTLLHVEDRALGKRDHRQQFLAVDECLGINLFDLHNYDSMLGSMLFEPARQAVTSTIAAAALLGLPVAFVFLVAFTSGRANKPTNRETDHA